MDDNYNILIRKLDEFIRKYYRNQLVKGTLYALSALLLFFIAITALEYFAWFGTVVRAVLFWVYILTTAIILSKLIIIPLLKLFRIGKTLSHEQASQIIGKHFSDVSDSLLNTLQLKKIAGDDPRGAALIEAAINQKIIRIKPVPFTAAIRISQNKKYLRFALPPLLILLVVLIASPGLVTGPSGRLLRYNTFFEKPAPFQFNLLNGKLEAIQQNDFRIDVKLTGDNIPENIFMEMNGNEYRLDKENTVLFHYTLKNLQKDVNFRFSADGFKSKEYILKVIPRPMVLNFEVELRYPKYLNKKDETLENSGDLVVPYGTVINWSLKTKDTKKITFRFRDKTVTLDPHSPDFFNYSQALYLSQIYSVSSFNQYFKNPDSLQYTINVIPDEYPSITADEFRDSVYLEHLYFKGMIKDDYGFSRLNFKYRINRSDKETNPDKADEFLTVPISPGMNRQEFYYYFDLSTLNVQPGEEVEYYFEVWDNDGVNGPKASRSEKMTFKAPTQEEIEKETEKTNEQIKDELEQTIKETQQLQKQIDDLDKKLTEKKNLEWQEKKQIQDLLDKQQQLQNRVEDLKKMNQQNNIKEQQFNQSDPELMQKQQELEKLFNEVMTDEMKDLFRQLQEMMDKLDKNKVNDVLDQMKMSSEDMKKELDRNLELFKQLEFDKKLTETIDKLNKLSEEQKQLSEQTKNENNSKEELQKKQEELNKKFEDIKKDLEDLQQKNSELQEPKNMQNTDEKQNSIQQELNKSQNSLEKNKRKNAAESQSNAAEQEKELADQMQQEQDAAAAEEEQEDINALRTILENLVKVSFGQEELIGRIKNINVNDPKYVDIMEKQKDLENDLQLIEDSLFALSKRQTMIKPFINKEINLINSNVDKALQALQARNTGGAANSQQYVMTSVNNLALMLAEALQQMQQQQQQSKAQKSGKAGKCKKPGSGKPSAATMKQMQDQLNKQMQDLKKQMEQGQKPGQKPGQQNGGQNMSEQLAKLAAQQEALRRMLQQYGEELKKEGNGNDGNIAEMMKKMEQTETDLVNKSITEETLKRQQEILTRLLESEKAEKEREMDEKRESDQAKDKDYSNPNQFFEYNRIKSKELELLKTVPPALKSFYKYKVNEYFYNFGE